MADPRWPDIYGDRLPGYAPPSPRLSVPVVRIPICTEHCSGRHHVEALIYCPGCQVPAYKLWAHEWLHSEGHYFYSREPMNGAPPDLTACPDCGEALRR